MIGVHAPEFAFETRPANVRKAVADFGIGYPVALDNNLAIWRAFNNHYWPAHYLADAKGRHALPPFRRRQHRRDRGGDPRAAGREGRQSWATIASVTATGAGAAADFAAIRSPETYVGSAARAELRLARRTARRRRRLSPARPISRSTIGHWRAAGRSSRSERCQQPGGRIAFRFRARDLHLVLGSSTGKPVRFRVTIDGKAPGADHGMDIDAAGNGQVTGQRLYQLVRQKEPNRERLFTITFLDPGAEAYAFTFG